MLRIERIATMPKEKRLFMLEEFPSRLAKDGQFEHLYTFLTSYDFLKAKVDEVGVEPLIRDYEIANDADLRLIQSALRLSAPILQRDATALAHQLVGRLMLYRKQHNGISTFTDRLAQQPHQLIPVHLDGQYAPLPPAGGPLLATIQGPAEGALELSDGHILSWKGGTTGGDHNSWCLWDSSGQLLTILPEVHKYFSMMGYGSVSVNVLALPNKRFLSWAADTALRLWDSDGQLLIALEHTDSVRSALVLSDGRFLSWGGNTLRLWSNDGLPLATLEGHTGLVGGAIALANGRLLTWAEDSAFRLWDSNGQAVATLKGPLGGGALANGRFLPRGLNSDPDLRLGGGALALSDGRFLSWAGDRPLQLWDSDGQLLTTLEGHTEAVEGTLVLSDGRFLSWGGNTLRLWSNDGLPLATLEGHTGLVGGAIALANGRFLSWGSPNFSALNFPESNILQLWGSDGQALATLEHIGTGGARALALANGSILSWASGGNFFDRLGDNTLRLWDSDGQALATLEGHTDSVRGVSVLADERLLSWADDGTLRLWDIQKQPLSDRKGHKNSVSAAFAVDSGRLLSWADDNTLQLWDSDGQPLATLEGHTDSVRGAFALTNGRFLSWAADTALRLWDSDGQLLTTLEGHTEAVEGTLVLSDGRFLSWGGNTLRLWSSDGQLLATLEGHTEAVGGALALSDGRFLSWGGNTLRLWSNDGLPLATLEEHPGYLTNAQRLVSWPTSNTAYVGGALALSDGRFLSWGGNTLRLWSNDGLPLATLEGHDDKVIGVQILRDGSFFSWASVYWYKNAFDIQKLSGDSSLRLWNSQGQPVKTLHLGGRLAACRRETDASRQS